MTKTEHHRKIQNSNIKGHSGKTILTQPGQVEEASSDAEVGDSWLLVYDFLWCPLENVSSI